jgi:hypothetical protein
MSNENNLMDLDNSNAELYRRQLLALSNENDLLRQNVRELQEQVYAGYKRIKELSEG